MQEELEKFKHILESQESGSQKPKSQKPGSQVKVNKSFSDTTILFSILKFMALKSTFKCTLLDWPCQC